MLLSPARQHHTHDAARSSNTRRDDPEERQFHEGLTIARRKLGADHPQVTRILLGLAAMHRDKGHYSESIECFKEGHDLMVQRLGTNLHEDVAGILVNIGNVYRQWGALNRAMHYYRTAMNVYEAVGISNASNKKVACVRRIMERIESSSSGRPVARPASEKRIQATVVVSSPTRVSDLCLEDNEHHHQHLLRSADQNPRISPLVLE
mmetsp:Transcript_29123/g.42761  ORF Transcript_29123/g.42761 Transcript_29123/m.42761 type:complete len:207 (-) Transcript_29123:237-857(-)|eukprot:CAMPEP_0116026312 /NCGR_PEP_ID=MMETSP0321-20121206/13744_1 /TAXON_ID=163516 /ORGANISM="Leptocylindrus danicus var. danicus, Strain B650" /LENGTH=206 /DNA_ID=CAMNT_0003499023 /DNA_START=93 /DNA_END=713 /DNA_ORIENTATION=-